MRFLGLLNYLGLNFSKNATGPTQLVSLTNLLAHWQLEEAAGTREDAHTTNKDLTDVNTVTQNTGKINNAAEFTTANNEGLSNTGTTFTLSADRTFCGWFYLGNKDLVYTLFSKWNLGQGTEYQCRYNSVTDRFEWLKGDGDVTFLEAVKADTFGSPTAAIWYFIVCKYNHTTKIFSISVNDGAFDNGVNAVAPTSSNGLFYLGRLDAAVSLPLTGRLDSFSIFGRLLTAGEITSLYNAGNGLDYPFTS